MANPAINFAGFLYDDAGDAISGATVNLYDKNTSTTSRASTTTDSNGAWSIAHTTAGEFDVQITSGSSKRRIKFDDKVHLSELDAETINVRGNEGAAAPLYFFSDEGDDAGDRWLFNAAAGGVFTMGNDINTQGTYVAHVTITPNSTVANSTFAIAGGATVGGSLTLSTVAAAGTDTDKFLVLDSSGNVDYRTGTQVASDIGAITSGVSLSGSTDNTVVTVTGSNATQGEANLTFDGSTLAVTGDLTVSGGDGALQFTNAGENSIKIPDNQASALIIEEANNAYMTFVSSNSSEKITFAKALDIDADVQIDAAVTVGVNDTGHDVKFFGASSGAYFIYDQSEDQVEIRGAAADATTSTGKLLLTTALTDINANDVIGKVSFQAPLEAGGTDAITVAASIEAVAQGTFSASVNATDIIFKTGHSEAATEKFRFTSQGEIGIGGANYGSDGQVLTSGGAGAAPAWESVASGTITVRAGETLAAGAPVALENNSGTIEAVNIHGWGNDLADPTTDNNIYKLSGQMGSGTLVSCGSAGIAWVYTSENSDSQSYGYCYASIGTYSTTTRQIEWSAPVAVTSAQAQPVTASWDSNRSRLLIIYSISGANTKGVCYAISSGALVTAGATAPGTAVDVTGGATFNELHTRIVFDSDNNMHHLLYEDGGDSDYLKLAGLSVSADNAAVVAVTIAGTKVNGANTTTGGFDLVWGNDKACIVYEDDGDSGYTKAVIATHNGSAYSWGSVVEPFGSNQTVVIPHHLSGRAVAYDSSNNNWVIGGYWTDSDSDVVLRLVAATNDLSTLGSPQTYNTVPDYLISENLSPAAGDSIATYSAFAGRYSIAVEYDPDRNCVAVITKVQMGDANQGFIDPEYEMYGQQPGQTDAGAIGKFAITYVTLGGTNDVVLTKGDMKVHHLVNRTYDMNGGTNTSYASNYGWMATYDTHHNRLFMMAATAYMPIAQWGTNSYTNNPSNFSFAFEGPATSGDYSAYGSSNMGQFVGFATAGVTADGSATVTVTVKGGVNENQSSLTVGEEYWIADSGGLVVAPPKWAMHVYKAGIAIATDKLYVQNDYSSHHS